MAEGAAAAAGGAVARQGGPATKETRTLSAVLLGRRGCCCILCSAVQCCIVQCSAVQCSAVQPMLLCRRCCRSGGAAVSDGAAGQAVLLLGQGGKIRLLL